MHTLRVTAVAALALAAPASADWITFDDLAHGEIITNQFAGSGVTITGTNPNRGFDIVAAFDSTLTGTRDPDLEGPSWSGGNLAGAETVLGRLLILAENDWGAGDGFLNEPDDEGSRPAGSIDIMFDDVVDAFGLDLVDIENATSETGFLEFRLDGALLASVSVADFTDPASMFYDNSVAWGDHSANRIAPITAYALGIEAFDQVTIGFGGSGAIDSLYYSTIPAPSGALLILFALVRSRRRRTLSLSSPRGSTSNSTK